MDKKFLNIGELSQYLGIKKSNLYSKVERKEIPFYRFGRLIMFKKDEVDTFMEKCNLRKEAKRIPKDATDFELDNYKKEIYNKPIVKVNWNDAVAYNDNYSSSHEFKTNPVESVGRLFSKTKKQIVIIRDIFGSVEENDNLEISGIIVIPRQWVESIKILRKGYVSKSYKKRNKCIQELKNLKSEEIDKIIMEEREEKNILF